MATSTREKDFSSTLSKVAAVLTEEDVQKLVNQCTQIKPARRPLTKIANELFADLQGRGILHETKVNVLIEWMDSCHFFEASGFLKDYAKSHLQNNEHCSKHKDEKLEYFCLPCNAKVCSECTVSLHNSSKCEIIPLENGSQETKNRREKLSSKLQKIKNKIAILEDSFEERERFLKSRGGSVRDEIDSSYTKLLQQVNEVKLKLLKRVNEKEISDMQILLSAKSQIEEAKAGVTWLKSSPSCANGTNPCELMQVSEFDKKVKEIAIELERTRISKKNSEKGGLFYSRVYCHGSFIQVNLKSVIGIVLITKDQLVKAIDNRQEKGVISLVSSGVKDSSKKEHWKYSVSADHQQSPILIANEHVSLNGDRCILLAVGKKVFIVKLHETDENDSVTTESVISFTELCDDSYITSISVSHAEVHSSDSLFIISVSSSSALREYNISGEIVKLIEINDMLPPFAQITYAARRNNIIATIVCGRDDVILVKDDGESLHQVGSLIANGVRCNSPSIVMFIDDVGWLVLYVSPEEPYEWEVSLYEHTGEFARVCHARSESVGRTVGMTAFGKQGFVCLDDDTVESFNL